MTPIGLMFIATVLVVALCLDFYTTGTWTPYTRYDQFTQIEITYTDCFDNLFIILDKHT